VHPASLGKSAGGSGSRSSGRRFGCCYIRANVDTTQQGGPDVLETPFTPEDLLRKVGELPRS